ncbi:MAG: hypothetical protein K0Q74_1586 [Gammaproteobacteria bacterium]|nr:hypothetical protein [Gammaproteobacteria bacterium]
MANIPNKNLPSDSEGNNTKKTNPLTPSSCFSEKLAAFGMFAQPKTPHPNNTSNQTPIPNTS